MDMKEKILLIAVAALLLTGLYFGGKHLMDNMQLSPPVHLKPIQGDG
jgi:hypothetical protein